MKLRLLTGLACVLALGGCTSYGYVNDGGGGYYTGGSSTRYVYPSYGYGVYGYGSPYYRYNPGWSFGLGYGGGYGYGYGYPYYPAYRPPYYYAPPHYPRPPRPGHGNGPDHGGRPDHRPPPVAGGNPPPLDRAPWRDLERLRRGDGEDGGRRRQPGPATLGVVDAPSQGLRPDAAYARPMPTPGYRVAGPRPGGDNPMRVAQPQPRAERSMQRSAPRISESRGSDRQRSATRDTDEP